MIKLYTERKLVPLVVRRYKLFGSEEDVMTFLAEMTPLELNELMYINEEEEILDLLYDAFSTCGEVYTLAREMDLDLEFG